MSILATYAAIKAGLKIGRETRKGVMGFDKACDWWRDRVKRKYGIGKKPPSVPPAAGVAVALLLVCLTGCATSSIQAIRATGQEPTTFERATLPVCDGVSRFVGWIPFCGGQD
jgi:hypothetical protein